MAGTIGVLAAIIAMIMLHELGHFVMAKRAGMKVTEFFLGFGPRLWSIRRGETEYGVKAIPAGGYVRIIGMSNVDEVDPADEERTYRSKPYRHRLGVAVAGSTMHFIIAAVPAVPALAAAGLPTAAAGDRAGRAPTRRRQQSDFRARRPDRGRQRDPGQGVGGDPRLRPVPRRGRSSSSPSSARTPASGSTSRCGPGRSSRTGRRSPRVGIGPEQYSLRAEVHPVGHRHDRHRDARATCGRRSRPWAASSLPTGSRTTASC